MNAELYELDEKAVTEEDPTWTSVTGNSTAAAAELEFSSDDLHALERLLDIDLDSLLDVELER